MESAKILLLSVTAAVVYGVLHDQVTARVCVEYFTIGHPPIFRTESPTLLALGWGIIATWWVGVILGIPLAFVARYGNRPKLAVRDLVKPMSVLMASVGVISLVAGLFGYHAGVYLLEPLRSEVPADKHAVFLADLWAHSAAYFSGFAGAVAVLVWVWVRRRRTGPEV